MMNYGGRSLYWCDATKKYAFLSFLIRAYYGIASKQFDRWRRSSHQHNFLATLNLTIGSLHSSDLPALHSPLLCTSIHLFTSALSSLHPSVGSTSTTSPFLLLHPSSLGTTTKINSSIFDTFSTNRQPTGSCPPL